MAQPVAYEDTWLCKVSNGNVRGDGECSLVCTVCGEKFTYVMLGDTFGKIGSFGNKHRHEAEKEPKKMAPYGDVYGTYDFGGDIKVHYNRPSIDGTEIVLALAKASNFNVNCQERSNPFRTQYRLHCDVCGSDLDLGTRAITKAEIENPTTETSKFCVEHKHTLKVATPTTDNYRKFREE